MTLLYLVHVSCAALSIAGFALRGYWRFTNHVLWHHRATRILPHVVDTLLLLSAVGMLMLWQVSPLALDWVLAKILALLLYIGLGLLALRIASGLQALFAYLLALLVAAYIVSVALTHSPMGWRMLLS